MRGRDGRAGHRLAGCLLAGLLLLSLPAAFARAATAGGAPADSAARGATLVERGDFAAAADAYHRAAEQRPGSADLLYNWGTAALKAERTGEAVLALERAARLAPDDGDIAFNLARALERVGGELGPVARTPRPWVWIVRVRLLQWQGLSLLLVALAVALVAARIGLRARARLRALAGLLALCCWLLGAVAAAGAAARGYVAARGDAVLTGPELIAAREAPAAEAPEVFSLAPGHRIQVIEERGAYARARLSNGLEGWVERASLQLVESP